MGRHLIFNTKMGCNPYHVVSINCSRVDMIDRILLGFEYQLVYKSFTFD